MNWVVNGMILFLTLVLASCAPAQTPAMRTSTEVPQETKPQVLVAHRKLPLSFEANQGQTDPQVNFLSRGSGYTLFLTPTEAVLTLTRADANAKDAYAKRRNSGEAILAEPETRTGTVLRMKLIDANPTPRVTGIEELSGRSNYFIGNDPAKWRTNVPTYSKVEYRDVYPGVSLVYYGNQQQLEYDLVVAPGADPSTIGLSFVGADRLEVDGDGDLVLHTAAGTIRQRKPVIYQEISGVRKEISGGYVFKGEHQVGFKVAAYDASQPLVIDPVLSYSTYLGGSADDQGLGIAVDAAGNTYVTGATNSTNFPKTAGVFDTTFGGGICFGSSCLDVFVTKLDPTGSALLYSTYLGGTGNDIGFGIAVDGAGNAYVTGFTNSSNFPTTAGAFQTSFRAGGGDVFVTKLNPSGSALLYSTYLGGGGSDNGSAIAVDAAGSAYVTGFTNSSNFPTTAGAFQTSFGGFDDAFVTKLDPTGSVLLYSTYLRGSGFDFGNGIAVDATGNAYVTGTTLSTDFPTTPGAFQTARRGGVDADAFVTKLNPTGSALVYSTFLGGTGGNFGSAIAVDTAGSAYVAGGTTATNFPTTVGAFQTSFGGNRRAFVTKLDPNGAALVYSTFLGGTGSDNGSAIAVDAAGSAYVTGATGSIDFPTTAGAFQTAFGGGISDAFMAKLNSTGSALLYSTYLGGSGEDDGVGIAVDAAGNAYVVGATNSTNFPTTAGAFQPAFGDGICFGSPCLDAFVTKFSAFNTPAGTNVTVPLGKVTLTFANVTAAGDTTLTTSAAGPPPPAGFKLGNPPTYYDINTTATFSGFVQVCIDYGGIAFDNVNALRLMHFEGGGFVDVTTSLDTTAHVICGRTASLSPFAIVEPAVVPFASFVARVEIEKREFEVKGTFTLGARSNRIHPLTEDVTLQVGAFAATIPAGSFRSHGHHTFRFEGVAGGAALEVEIRSRGGNRFEVKAEGKGAQVGPANPVTVRLAVGDDAGSASVRVRVED